MHQTCALSGYLTVSGRDGADVYLRADPDAGLEEGMPCGAEKDGEGTVQGGRADGKERFDCPCVLGKDMEGSHEFLRIEDKSFFDTVIGAFGDIKVSTERKNGGELSGKPGIKEGDEEAE